MFELTSEFLSAEDIPFSVEDLRYGLEHGFLKERTVIELAADEARHGSSDPVMHELAMLLRDQVDQVPEMLKALDDPETIRDPRESARKWLYLELKAAYCSRDRLNDPLGGVEQIYAEFDYPPAMVQLVRYMPLPPGAEPGESALMMEWEDFLTREHEFLARGLS